MYFNAEDKKQYNEKLTLANGKKLPDPYNLNIWSDDI